MEELIAKKYIKAFKTDSGLASMEAVAAIFATLAESFRDKKFVGIINNPNVSSKDKSDILLASVKSANSQKLNNFIKLLAEHRRINIIPAIAKELQKEMSHAKKAYKGTVFSNSEINESVLKELGSNLGKRFDSTIDFNFILNDFNGIKVEVEGLGVEIDFSKDRIDRQVIDHIIKAI